jgi:hypothetical protein
VSSDDLEREDEVVVDFTFSSVVSLNIRARAFAYASARASNEED